MLKMMRLPDLIPGDLGSITTLLSDSGQVSWFLVS